MMMSKNTKRARDWRVITCIEIIAFLLQVHSLRSPCLARPRSCTHQVAPWLDVKAARRHAIPRRHHQKACVTKAPGEHRPLVVHSRSAAALLDCSSAHHQCYP